MNDPEFSDADYDEQFWQDEEYNEMEKRAESEITPHEKVEQTRQWLIDDIKTLPMSDVFKIYKYVRRYCIANIEGLIDPLDKP